jgi:hypothetical protein
MTKFFDERPSGTEIAKRVWSSTMSGMRAMPLLFLSAMVLALLVGVVSLYQSRFLLDRAGHSIPTILSPLRLLFGIGNILIWSALSAPVAVAMHRFILLGETTPGLLSYAPRHTRIFFLWALVLQFLFHAINTLAFLVPHSTGLIQLTAIRIVIAIVVLALSVHLAMIFPAIATEAPASGWQSRIAKSWHQMQGNFWLFIRAGILSFLPIILAELIGGYFLLRIGFGAAIVSAKSPAGPWLYAAWVGLIGILSVALGAALASWIYAWARRSE